LSATFEMVLHGNIDLCEFITPSVEFRNRWIRLSFYYNRVFISCHL